MDTCPLISIITPVYKFRPTVKECIESIMIQNYNNIEYIIVDDGPNSIEDRTITQYITRDDIKIKIIHNDANKGISESLNIGIKNSNGEIIFNLADDDKFFDC